MLPIVVAVVVVVVAVPSGFAVVAARLFAN